MEGNNDDAVKMLEHELDLLYSESTEHLAELDRLRRAARNRHYTANTACG
jgi:hypothetical protein